MKSLALIVSEASELESLIIESGGVLTPEIESFLAINEAELSNKIDGYDFIIDRLNLVATYYKEKADAMLKISRQCASSSDSLKGRIKQTMIAAGLAEIVGHEVRYSLSKSKPSLVIDDYFSIPQEYFAEKKEIYLDKEKIRKSLEVGPIEGAHMEPSFALRVNINKQQIGEKSGK